MFTDHLPTFMMQELEKIYDAAFFEEWGRSNRAYVDSAFRITQILYQYFLPRTLIDWGCGCGAYSYFFKELGVSVTGVDAVISPDAERFPIEIMQFDLTEPIPENLGYFDLSLCFEVGEHIPVQFRDVFIENITRFSDTLLLSCAPPKQGGVHHVNEQPKRYWIEALREHGFGYDRGKTGHIVEKLKAIKPRFEYAWMFRHISIYERFVQR